MWDWCKDDWDHPKIAENNKPGFKTVNQDSIFIRFKKLLPRLDDSYAQWWFKTSESGVRLSGFQSEHYHLFTWVSQFNGLNLSLPIKWNGNTRGITCLEAWIRSCGQSVYSNAWCINGFPWWLGILLPMRRSGFGSWVEKIPWRWKWQTTPVFLPGKSHGQGSLAVHGVTKSWSWLRD